MKNLRPCLNPAPAQFSVRFLKEASPFLLLAILAVQGIYFAAVTGQTTDETFYNGTGYATLRYSDYRYSGEHPPLMMQLGSLPLLFIDPNFPIENPVLLEGPGREIDLSRTGSEFLYKRGNNPQFILFLERLPVLLLVLITGFFLYQWSRLLFGQGGGLLSLALYAFCPNIIAHGSLFTTDFGVSAFMFLATYALYRFFLNPTLGYAALAGVLSGCAFLSKISALTLVPAFVLIFAAALCGRGDLEKGTSLSRLRFGAAFYATAFFLLLMSFGSKVVMPFMGPLCLAALTSFSLNGPFLTQKRIVKYGILTAGWITSVIYAIRLFEKYESMVSLGILFWIFFCMASVFIIHRGFLNEAQQNLVRVFLWIAMVSAVTLTLGYTDFWRSMLDFNPFDHYIRSFNIALTHSRSSHANCLEGSLVTCDWRYFPALILVKTSLWAVFLILVGFFLFLRSKGLAGIFKIGVLAIPGVFLLVAVFLNKINIGLRHILPVYPFFFLLAGSVAASLSRVRDASLRVFIFLFLIAGTIFYAARTLKESPHYLSYFSEWVGGVEKGGHLVSDSNLDWGQGNKRLAEFVLKRKIPHVNIISSVSNEDLYNYYGISWDSPNLTNLRQLKPGFYAVSIDMLREFQKNPASPFYERPPDAKIGKTLYFYEIN